MGVQRSSSLTNIGLYWREEGPGSLLSPDPFRSWSSLSWGVGDSSSFLVPTQAGEAGVAQVQLRVLSPPV